MVNTYGFTAGHSPGDITALIRECLRKAKNWGYEVTVTGMDFKTAFDGTTLYDLCAKHSAMQPSMMCII